MVLTKEHLNEEMTTEEQRKEIERIKQAPNGLVLFITFMNDKESANMCETLFRLAGCAYHESLWLSRGMVKWVKGSMRFNYNVA